ncbi:unnamed protein product [Vicia faba]|uniref:DUF4283 domain-containing protein n=1 Tax=Vicia faba TaxID=3906 RepID=A0AAV0ZBT8_VICFA|nr:unnamed protein product [Vicia faba]
MVMGTEQDDHEELEVDEEDKEDTDMNEIEGMQVVEEMIGGYECPAFTLTETKKKQIYHPWKRCVIVKLLGRKIGYKTLESRPNFEPLSDTIDGVTVWVRISGVPIEFYDAKVLTGVSNRIGRAVKIDKNTMQHERGKYARFCVMVNLSKPLVVMFSMEGKKYKVECEGEDGQEPICEVLSHASGVDAGNNHAENKAEDSLVGANVQDGLLKSLDTRNKQGNEGETPMNDHIPGVRGILSFKEMSGTSKKGNTEAWQEDIVGKKLENIQVEQLRNEMITMVDDVRTWSEEHGENARSTLTCTQFTFGTRPLDKGLEIEDAMHEDTNTHKVVDLTGTDNTSSADT